MKYKNITICLIMFIAGITTGFYVLLFLLNLNFNFSREIGFQLDPINLATLLITVLLAIYVTREMNKRNEQERVEKDLIIEDLKKFKLDLIMDVKKILETERISLIMVTSKLKTSRMNLNLITKLIDEYKFAINDEVVSGLDTKIRDIKDLLTETPAVSGTTSSEITINNGEISLGSNQREKIDVALNEMSALIFKLVIEINRS